MRVRVKKNAKLGYYDCIRRPGEEFDIPDKRIIFDVREEYENEYGQKEFRNLKKLRVQAFSSKWMEPGKDEKMKPFIDLPKKDNVFVGKKSPEPEIVKKINRGKKNQKLDNELHAEG